MFKARKGKLYTHLLGKTLKEIPRGQWVNERFFRHQKDKNIIFDFSITGYYTGWHGFGSKLNAKIWKGCVRDDVIVLRVKYRKAVAHGSQEVAGRLKLDGKHYKHDARVIVAKEIFIPKD